MDYNCIVMRLREITTLTDKFYENEIKKLRLPILKNHIPLFYILSGPSKPLAFTEIFKKLSMSKSSLSEVITKYQLAGFIEKISSTEDKRSFTIFLTEEGLDIKRTLSDLENQIMAKIYNNFDDEARSFFEINADKILSNLNSN